MITDIGHPAFACHGLQRTLALYSLVIVVESLLF